MKKLTLIVCVVLLSIQIVSAQTRQVTGIVTSADDGLGMPGVSVVIKGTTSGTSTDIDGKYTLNAESSDVLLFSFVGMTAQEIPVGNQTVINVTLDVETIGMDEVVVTAFGIERVAESVGYSVSLVDEEELLDNAEPDILRSMTGKIPGVTIGSATGAPGAASKINIRGATSFTGDNQPLFVIDGVPYSNDNIATSDSDASIVGGQFSSGISSVDPNDIKSIQVLKGGAASALYGSRAANGVVLITTKSGAAKVGGVKKGFGVNITSSYGFEEITSNLPDYQNKYGPGTNFEYANFNGSWGAAFSTRDSIPTPENLTTNFPDQFGDNIAYVARPNNVKDLFDTGIIHENSVNITHGGETSTFNLTMSEVGQKGYIPHSGFDRKSFALGGTAKLSEQLSVGGNMSFSHVDQDGPLFGNNQISGGASSFARALWPGRSWNWTEWPYENANGEPVIPNGGYDHPLWSWKHNTNNQTIDRTVLGMNASYEILPGLTAGLNAGYNRSLQEQQTVTDIGSRGAEGLGEIRENSYVTERLESTFTLSLNKDVSEDFNIQATAGLNVSQNDVSVFRITGTEIINPGIYKLRNTKSQSVTSDYTTRDRIMGLFAQATLGYRDYLYLTLNGRNDWNSALYLPEGGVGNETTNFFYPGATLAYVFTNHFDLSDTPIDFGKLRFGWSKVGGVGALGPYDNNAVFITDPSAFGVNLIRNSTSLSNPVLSPEFTKEFEIGGEFRFLEGRITLDATYYDRTTTDILVPLTVPRSTGFSTYYTNIGEMTNKGVEIGLGLTPVRINNGFSWEIFSSFTTNENKVTKIIEGIDQYAINVNEVAFVKKGEPLGVFVGSSNYRDDNGNFLIDRSTGQLLRNNEQEVIGDPNIDFRLGITNTFKYKGLSLRVFFDWREGGDVFSNTIASLLGRGVTRDTEDREEGNYIIPGVYGDPNTGEPMLDGSGNSIPNTTGINMNNLYFGESFAINSSDEMKIYDGTTYRLRELSLNYTLPSKWLDNTFLTRASIGFTGNNLWFFAPNIPKYTNFDPEVSSFGASNVQGIEQTAAPNPRRYMFNVKFSF
ncbi:SusC/RagA family TonB-linked outer membrane protein [Labilibaculum euxinus]